MELRARGSQLVLAQMVGQFIDEVAADRKADPLLWSISPELELNRFFPSEPGRQPAAGTLEMLRGLAPLALGRGRGLRFLVQGEVLYAFSGTAASRTLSPIIERRQVLTGLAPHEIEVPMSPVRLFEWARRARELAADLVAAAQTAALDVDARRIYRLTFAGARAFCRGEAALARTVPSLVVVATQHAAIVRPVLHLARIACIPTLYFPHAPVADNRAYKDLPVDRAALRGQGEVDFYRKLGAEGELTVVGNPAVCVDDPPPLDESLPPVLAMSDPKRADEIVDFVAAAVTGEVLVAPHPRDDVAAPRRRYPDHWRVWSAGSTFDLLRQGPTCFLQYSSGVAWEALALGIPTIELSSSGCSNYPLIAEPHVTFARNTDELKKALATSADIANDPERRHRLTEWAKHWCCITGIRATDLCVDQIEVSLASRVQSGPLLDSWRAIGNT